MSDLPFLPDDPGPGDDPGDSDPNPRHTWMADITLVVAHMGIANLGASIEFDKADQNDLLEAILRLARQVGIELERKDEPGIVTGRKPGKIIRGGFAGKN